MNTDLTLERFAYAPSGTFGRMAMPDGEILYTVEDPWRGNARGESCIPEGRYVCEPRPFHRGGYPAVHVTDVPDRQLILFHIANSPVDVRGCVGVGQRLGWVHAQWAVLDSRAGFARFMEHYKDRVFVLDITRYAPDDMVRTALSNPNPATCHA
jgi:hypothetical protein